MPLTARRPTQQLVDLVGTLGGTWHGHVAMCRCPAHSDTTPSLSIRQGDRDILVTCFAGCARDDVLRELRRVRPDHHYPSPTEANPPHTGNVVKLWEQAIDVRGTLAERYLSRRHLLPPPADIRFHPRCPYMPKPKTVYEPALLIAVREVRRLVALQRIFLDPETADYTRKVMLGMPGSGAWRGGEGDTILAIAEGFETAGAFARLHAVPCWASLGARRLDRLIIPSAVEVLLIAQDNDPEGRRGADKAENHYRRPGLIIKRAPPPARFKDWAKVLDASFRRVSV
jgi:hypothetical protein